MSLYPLCCLIELKFLFLLFCLFPLHDCFKLLALPRLFKSLFPLFFDLLQVLSLILVFFCNNVLLFVVISHFIVVSFKSFTVTFISLDIFLIKLSFILCILFLSNCKIFLQLLQLSIKSFNLFFMPFLCSFLNTLSFIHQLLLPLSSFCMKLLFQFL